MQGEDGDLDGEGDEEGERAEPESACELPEMACVAASGGEPRKVEGAGRA